MTSGTFASANAMVKSPEPVATSIARLGCDSSAAFTARPRQRRSMPPVITLFIRSYRGTIRSNICCTASGGSIAPCPVGALEPAFKNDSSCQGDGVPETEFGGCAKHGIEGGAAGRGDAPRKRPGARGNKPDRQPADVRAIDD